LHGRQHDERQRGHPIRDAAQYILGGVGVRQRRVARAQQQGEQQHNGSGTEVAAAYRDHKDRGGLEIHGGRMPLVAGDSRLLVDTTWQPNRERRQTQQDQYDGLETLCGRWQQQGEASCAAERSGGSDALDPAVLSG
jgi:type II secretory pathway component PulM